MIFWKVEQDGARIRVLIEAQMVNDRVVPGAPLREVLIEGTSFTEIRQKLAEHDVWLHFGPDEALQLGWTLAGKVLTNAVSDFHGLPR